MFKPSTEFFSCKLAVNLKRTMHTITFVYFSACLTTLLSVNVCSSLKQGESFIDNERNIIIGQIASTGRWQRSVAGIWLSGLRILLRNTKEIPTKSSNNRKFEKKGTRKNAFRDYMWLKSDTGRGKVYRSDAFSGPLNVQIKTQRVKPSIVVSNPNSGSSIEIIYKH